MSLSENVSGLIGDIYRGAFDKDIWTRNLEAIRRMTGSKFVFSAVLDTRDLSFNEQFFHGCDSANFLNGIHEYNSFKHKEDPAIAFVTRNPSAKIFRSRQAISADTYLKNEYIRWHGDRLGSTSWMLAYTPAHDDLAFGIALHPPTGNEPPEGDQERFFMMLFDHIDCALRLAARPPRLDDPHEAKTLVDQRGNVLEVSCGLDALLRTTKTLSISNRKIKIDGCKEQSKLDRLIMSATDALASGGCGGAIITLLEFQEEPTWRRFALKVSPLPPQVETFPSIGARAIVRIIPLDRQTSNHPAHNFKEIFGLTSAEARLLHTMFVTHNTLRECADQFGISYATARVQMAQILQKLECHGQTDLFRLLEKLQ